jgi:hypothetical protein
MTKPTPAEVELQLLRGFVGLDVVPTHGERKKLAARIRARCVAAELGIELPMKSFSDSLGVSERNLYRQFERREALFAFPPPELAVAIGESSHNQTSWLGVASCVGAIFAQLDENAEGKDLLRRLATLFRKHGEMARSDAHFACELRKQILLRPHVFDPCVEDLVGHFTDRMRAYLMDWALADREPITSVSERLEVLLLTAPSHYLLLPAESHEGASLDIRPSEPVVVLPGTPPLNDEETSLYTVRARLNAIRT